VLGYVLGGAGIAAVGVGSYFGVKAISTWNERDSECEGNTCSPRGLELEADTDRYANYANAGIGLGLIGTGLGAYLILTHGDERASEADRGVSVVPAVGPMGAALQGSW